MVSIPKIKGSKNIVILCLVAVIIVSIAAGLGIGAEKFGYIVFNFFVIGVPITIAYFGLSSIRKLIFINLFISICLVLSLLFWHWEITFLITLPLFFYAVMMLLINLISIFIFWQEHDSTAFVPLLISILTIPALVYSFKASKNIDIFIDDYKFKRQLPKYEAAIKILEKKIETGPFELYGKDVPVECQPLANCVTGEKQGKEYTIKLLKGREGGYAYFSGEDKKLPNDLLKYRKITAHWFKVPSGD